MEEDANSWYKIGNDKMTEGRSEDAIAAYDKATSLNPKLISAWNNKGIALFRLKRYEDSISCYDKAIDLDPNYANAWYNKANSLRGLAQSFLDKANDDRTTAAKMINTSLGLFESANQCYDKGESLSQNKS